MIFSLLQSKKIVVEVKKEVVVSQNVRLPHFFCLKQKKRHYKQLQEMPLFRYISQFKQRNVNFHSINRSFKFLNMFLEPLRILRKQ